MIKFQLLFLFSLFSICLSITCWSGQREQYSDGNWKFFAIHMECNADYCSNLTIFRSSINTTVVEFRCGSDILEDCNVSIKYSDFSNFIFQDNNMNSCTRTFSRTSILCCCNQPLCNHGRNLRDLVVQSLILWMTGFLFSVFIFQWISSDVSFLSESL